MRSIIHTRVYPEPKFRPKEALRYAGAFGESEEMLSLLEETSGELLPRLDYKVCYCELDAAFCDGAYDLGFALVSSNSLARCLSGCERIILFAATIGLELDRAARRYSSTSGSRALMAQGIGAERIESLCDAFCLDIAREYEAQGFECTPRFSPGYGDLPLDLQRDIFAYLKPEGRIGITLNESLLMTPTKSVTAIVGLRRKVE